MALSYLLWHVSHLAKEVLLWFLSLYEQELLAKLPELELLDLGRCASVTFRQERSCVDLQSSERIIEHHSRLTVGEEYRGRHYMIAVGIHSKQMY